MFTDPTDPQLAPTNGGCVEGVATFPNIQNPKDTPCEKTKAMLQKPEVKAKINELKNQAKLPKDDPNYGEKAFKRNSDGTTSNMYNDGLENTVSTGSEDGWEGEDHNHPIDKIKMVSVGDIIKLLNYAIYQPAATANNANLGMIGATICSACPDGFYYYHYIIYFSGNIAELNQLVNGSNWDLVTLRKDYKKTYSDLLKKDEYKDNQLETMNNKGLEKLFFETLSNMNLQNKISLQRVDYKNDGTVNAVQNITLNADNQPQATPCL